MLEISKKYIFYCLTAEYLQILKKHCLIYFERKWNLLDEFCDEDLSLIDEIVDNELDKIAEQKDKDRDKYQIEECWKKKDKDNYSRNYFFFIFEFFSVLKKEGKYDVENSEYSAILEIEKIKLPKMICGVSFDKIEKGKDITVLGVSNLPPKNKKQKSFIYEILLVIEYKRTPYLLSVITINKAKSACSYNAGIKKRIKINPKYIDTIHLKDYTSSNIQTFKNLLGDSYMNIKNRFQKIDNMLFNAIRIDDFLNEFPQKFPND